MILNILWKGVGGGVTDAFLSGEGRGCWAVEVNGRCNVDCPKGV